MDTRESSRPSGRPDTLTVHDGQAETVTGDEVVARVAGVLRESMPLVPFDDPYWPTLHTLTRAVGVITRPVRGVPERQEVEI